MHFFDLLEHFRDELVSRPAGPLAFRFISRLKQVEPRGSYEHN